MNSKTKSSRTEIRWILSLLLIVSWSLSLKAEPQVRNLVGGFNLIEYDDGLKFDAAESGERLPAQDRILEIKSLGAKHVILNVRAIMVGPRGNQVQPWTPAAEQASERARMVRLMRYIRSLGMSVEIRPIVLVIGPNGEFPYGEKRPDGSVKWWWHGNIQPTDPAQWFQSFRAYLEIYLQVAEEGQADVFTIGAELASLTVGDDEWREHPYGVPHLWLDLLRDVRSRLSRIRIGYDINFSDAEVTSDGGSRSGGELELWRLRLVKLRNTPDPDLRFLWESLADFWRELDIIGIDMYRSLARDDDPIPEDFTKLKNQLKRVSDAHARQFNWILAKILIALDMKKGSQPVMFKEVGFRSVEKGFIDPFRYVDDGIYNELHQAAAFAAVFSSFWEPGWSWFKGLYIWNVPLDPRLSGPGDHGFNPIGKPLSEGVIRSYFRSRSSGFAKSKTAVRSLHDKP